MADNHEDLVFQVCTGNQSIIAHQDLLDLAVVHRTKHHQRIQLADKAATATNQDHLIQMSSISPSTVKEDLVEVLEAASPVVALTVLMGLEDSAVE